MQQCYCFSKKKKISKERKTQTPHVHAVTMTITITNSITKWPNIFNVIIFFYLRIFCHYFCFKIRITFETMKLLSVCTCAKRFNVQRNRCTAAGITILNYKTYYYYNKLHTDHIKQQNLCKFTQIEEKVYYFAKDQYLKHIDMIAKMEKMAQRSNGETIVRQMSKIYLPVSDEMHSIQWCRSVCLSNICIFVTMRSFNCPYK